jgi:hypothetical protein
MSNIGVLGVVGLVIIVIALLGWILIVVRAARHADPADPSAGDLKRGPVSGGAIHGDPGQNILTGEAPRQDEPRENGPADR